MFTQCPQCGSYFRVREQDLAVADGDVRCLLCNSVFNARDRLEKEPPGEDEPDETHDHETPPARDPLTPDLFDDAPVGEADEATHDESTPAADTEHPLPEPDWLHDTPPEPRGPRYPALWTLGCLLLLFTLGVQLVHADRHYWVSHPVAGEWVDHAYRQLGMDVAPRRSLDALTIRRSNIAGVSNRPGALRVTGVIENIGEQAQPLPAVYVRLEDRWGMSMGYAFFEPTDWYQDGTLPERIRPGQTVALRLDLADPGREAVGFHLELCWQEDDAFACRPQRGGAAFNR